MNTSSTPRRAHHKPPIRRATRLSGILEKIVSEILWHNVVVEQSFPAMVFAVGRVEDVQRTIVSGVFHVVDIVLDLHLDRIAFVVLAALELLVAILLSQSLESPLGLRFPAVLEASNDHWSIVFLVAVNELLAVYVWRMDALNIVLEKRKFIEVLGIVQFIPSLR